MSTIDIGLRLGDTIDPFHLANGFEAVIRYECQERSNPPSLTPTMHIIHARCYKASEWVGGSLQCRRGILVILWMSLVDFGTLGVLIRGNGVIHRGQKPASRG